MKANAKFNKSFSQYLSAAAELADVTTALMMNSLHYIHFSFKKQKSLSEAKIT